MIVVIDYGMGNLGSVVNMLKKVGAPSICVSSDLDDIRKAEKLVLPGVGHFSKGVSNLRRSGIFDVVNHEVLVKNTPILGICLGMHLMCRSSQEGEGTGFGWFDTEVVGFRSAPGFQRQIPHMGWGVTRKLREDDFTQGIEEFSKFYHVHSYYVPESADAIFNSHYGFEFVSGCRREHIIGVQFHPEKSHKFGMVLMRNFLSIDV